MLKITILKEYEKHNELAKVKFKLFFKHLVQSRNSQLHVWFIITVHFAFVF